MGIDSAIDTSPLFTWNDTRTTAAADFAKTCLSSWGTAVTYSNIQLAPYSPKIRTQTTTPAAPQTTSTPPTEPNMVVRTKDASLSYDWTVARTSQNPNGILHATHGGTLTALVQITEVDALNTATIMIGASSDPTKTVAARTGGIDIFKGAEYNVQLQATPDNGFASMRRAVVGKDSLYEAANTIGDVRKLTQKAAGSTTYPVCKIWVRYTPSRTTRLFEMGLTTDLTASVETAQALWSFTEPVTTQAPLQSMSISSWNTACTIKEINIIQATGAANSTLATGQATEAAITYDGTISSQNMPIESQWTAASYQMKPNTIHKITTYGTAKSRGVVAFSTTNSGLAKIPFRIVLDTTGIKIYQDTELKSSNSTPLQGINELGASYWIKIVDGALSLGGYTEAGAVILQPYVTWSDDILKGSNTWFFTIGATEDATITYLGSSLISNQASTLQNQALPVILRTSVNRNVPKAPVLVRPTPAPQARNRVLSSAELEQSRYRKNVRSSAK